MVVLIIIAEAFVWIARDVLEKGLGLSAGEAGLQVVTPRAADMAKPAGPLGRWSAAERMRAFGGNFDGTPCFWWREIDGGVLAEARDGMGRDQLRNTLREACYSEIPGDIENAGASGRALLFTVGHSNHAIEHFLGLLRRHRVEAVADVRARPYSRFVPHFSKDHLERLLNADGLGYLYLGAELGGKPRGGETTASVMTYQRRVAQPEFREGIERLLEAARPRPIALMCRERDQLDCHRLHLICRYLAPQALDIRHILPSGEVEAQAATEQRLLDRTARDDLPLFPDAAQPAEALERAYEAWWRQAR